MHLWKREQNSIKKKKKKEHQETKESFPVSSLDNKHSS